jgi:Flp pilus assembly protein TadB
MTTQVLLLIPALLIAAGSGFLAGALLPAVDELMRAGLGWRASLGWRKRMVLSLARITHRPETKTPLPTEEELYGLPRSVVFWMVVAGLAGLAFTWMLLDGPLEVLGLGAGVVPIVWQRRRLERARHETRRQVAWLIEEVRLRLIFGGSLGPVLAMLAEEARAGAVFDRLRLHKDLISFEGPEAVLDRLASDLRSPELRLLLRRVRGARRGGTSYSEALQAAAAEVAREVVRRAEIAVEGAPMRLLFPMLILLLPPILTLLLYPPAYGLIDTLTGAGSGIIP